MAGQVTYSSLFTLVQQQINNSIIFNNATPLGSQICATVSAPQNNSTSVMGSTPTTQLMSAIQQLLAQALPQRIIAGLYVTAQSPISNAVNIAAGSGTVGGIIYDLELPTVVAIPFDNINNVFYINLVNDAVTVNTTGFSGTQLTLAKIVVPEPGVSILVQDKKDNSGLTENAYIVEFQEFDLYADQNGNLEEDSLEFFRDNIGCILANNLIGNIELSENLMVTNTQGTLCMDSCSIDFFDSNSDLMARIDQTGSYYYNSCGIPLAMFSTAGACVGNIEILPHSIQSNNFISGPMGQGFQITDIGNAQFNNICARGIFQTTVFQADTISAVGGSLLVLNSDTLSSNMTSASTSPLVTCGTSSFVVGDTLRMKNCLNDEWLQVISCTPGTCTYTVCRDMSGNYNGIAKPLWPIGTAVIDYGKVNSGGIYMTASDSCSPYLSMFVNPGSPWLGTCVCTVLGNLTGVTDSILGTLKGYGLYSGNVYLTGCMFASHIASALTGARIDFNTSCFYAYDCLNIPVFQLCFGTVNTGDLILGNTCYDYMKWSGMCHCLSFCTISGNCSVKIGGGQITANQVILQDPNCTCNYSFLSAGLWYFHDTLGNSTPYIRRLCSGTANTGTNIILCGWTNTPSIMVGIQTMTTYNASNSGACQRWCVFNDSPLFFCTSGICFGFCFGVHACLIQSAGIFNQCVDNVGFGTCVVTNCNVDCTFVQSQFSLWATDSCYCHCYCYGSLCYTVAYRCCCTGCAWTCCSFVYTQPNSSLSALTSCNYQCCLITFPSTGTYFICSTQNTLNWCQSTICQAIFACCCRTLTGGVQLLAQVATCNNEGNDICAFCCQINLSGTVPPGTIFCNFACVCWSGQQLMCYYSGIDKLCCLYMDASLYIGCTIADCSCCTIPVSCTSQSGATWNLCIGTDLTSLVCTPMNCLLFCTCTAVCSTRDDDSCLCACTNICFCGGYLIQCYYQFCCNATCSVETLFSTTDTSNAATVLDPSGVLSWLAVSP